MSEAIDRLPRRADARRNRQKLLNAARILIDDHGRDLALEEVARHAGVAIGTLYNHFPTRQALFQTLFADDADELRQRAEDWRDDPDPAETLIRWLRLQLEYGARGRSMGASVMNMRHEEGSSIQQKHAAMHEAGETLLRRAQASGQIRADVGLSRILRLVLGILLANEDAPDPDGTTPMFEILIDGIRTAGKRK
ncbi:TetR/AcrR family transcriptional regulator [uncultured Jatrophihabitans sp.]|uniref:TetR/AcrR family transcriptional regulator n=1 Tax=uncultured Jatrophihabitans sp. TaxID=1610747 RepID=UPI0035C9C479